MSTYTPIASQTLTSAALSVTFNAIPQNFTDLIIVVTPKLVSGTAQVLFRLNGDSGSNYSLLRTGGTGSAYGSDAVTPVSFGQLSWYGYAGATFGQVITASLNNYSNSTTYKTMLSRPSNANYGVGMNACTWRNTAAVTSILIYSDTANFDTGSTFNLYGIVANGTPKATGGNAVTTDGTYWYHTFTSSGSFTPNTALTADYLVVAGGGSGGGGGAGSTGGGGGAGGLRSTVGATGGGGSLESALSLAAQSYTVTVGAGGAGLGTTGTSLYLGNPGSNSTFSTITSLGGGGGTTAGYYAGGTGGSGGGASYSDGGAGAGTTNQGYAGAIGDGSNYGTGGGGGGAGAAGTAGGSTTGGNGGAGVAISALATATNTGVSNYYAGGGGGSVGYIGTTRGTGGAGGGGTGASNSAVATSGTANTGGGGGAASQNAGYITPGNGGSGIVIIRYAV